VSINLHLCIDGHHPCIAATAGPPTWTTSSIVSTTLSGGDPGDAPEIALLPKCDASPDTSGPENDPDAGRTSHWGDESVLLGVAASAFSLVRDCTPKRRGWLIGPPAPSRRAGVFRRQRVLDRPSSLCAVRR